MERIKNLQNRIYKIRGENVMLDSDLAALYETETQVLRLAAKLNRKRFPGDFMFQLSSEEFEELRFQFETSKQNTDSLRSQFVISKTWDDKLNPPYVFTELGIVMLSGVLKSDIAIRMSIAIIRSYVKVTQAFLESDIREQLKALKEQRDVHDPQLSQILEVLDDLRAKNAVKKPG